MSRFRSESRFMNPQDPARSQARPIMPFYTTIATTAEAHAEAKKGSFYFPLDHEESLLGRPIVSRLGAYRHGFRRSGPEIGEGFEVDG